MRALRERIRPDLSRRASGFALALLLEVLLLLVLLTLGRTGPAGEGANVTVVNLRATSEAQQAAAEPKPAKKPEPQRPRIAVQSRPLPPRPKLKQSQRTVPAPVASQPAPPALKLIPLSRDQLAAADLAGIAPKTPAAKPGAGKMGPVDTGTPGDSQRVGTAPDGKPLYAAAWYREPYPEELSGYLSTADAPGWGLIICRTAPGYRVKNCVGLDEYPQGSHIVRSILAAAWQFQVRPPRIGGVPQVGEWVRIRIDYGLRGPRAGR